MHYALGDFPRSVNVALDMLAHAEEAEAGRFGARFERSREGA